MKILLLIFLSLSAISVQAKLDEDSSWKKIRSSNRVYVDSPVIWIRTTQFNIFDLCHTDDHIRPLKNAVRKVCTRWRHTRNDDVCLKYKKVLFQTSINYSGQRCTRHSRNDCRRYEDYEDSHALEYDIDVYRLRLNGRDGLSQGRKLFTKSFTMPDCD